MKKELNGAHSSGGWVLALGTAAIALALFVPVPRPWLGETTFHTLLPGEWGAILALGLVTVAFGAFRKRLLLPHPGRRVRTAVILAVLQGVFLRLALEWDSWGAGQPLTWWPAEPWVWTPWFLTSAFAAMLLGSRLAILVSASGILLLYLRADPGPLPLVGCLVSSWSAILLLRRPSRGRVLRAGMLCGLLLGMVGFAEGVLSNAPLPVLGGLGLVPVAMAVISAFAVLAFLPVMEWLLGELSDVSLVEYSSGHRLLDQLKEQAPGTWHHSLNVADLAERAAAAIGGRSLFCRTAALYHDIGKLKDPTIFAENIQGPSPHDELPPRVSAERIIEHVTHGLELARKSRLPKPFRDIIAEHHGRSVMRFFYDKALAELSPGESPDALRPSFCYPGPLPSSRESGIIALADIVEAASRSFKTNTEAEARAFVRKLIADRMAESELARCPLTLAELAQVEKTFAGWVTARNHHRPAYSEAKAPGAPGHEPGIRASEVGRTLVS